MTRRLSPHGEFLARQARARQAEAVVRAHDDFPGSASDRTRRAQFEASLDDAKFYADVVRWAEDLPWPATAYEGPDRRSYFRDLMAAHDGDITATQRLAAHTKAVEERAGAEFRVSRFGGFAMPELRAITSTELAGLVPEGFASVGAAGGLPRSGRPLLDAFLADGARTDMPATGVDVTFVASTTMSVSATTTSAENVAVQTQDIVMVDQQVDVLTVAASITCSRQVLDRSDADVFIGRELTRALDEEQERRFVAGLLAAPTTVASNTATHRWVGSTALQAVRAGGDIREQPTRILAWHPRRFWWLSATRSDTTGSTFDTVMSQFEQGGHLTHVLSHQLLETGSLAGRDVIVAGNGDDVLYAEEPPRVFVTTNEDAGLLGVRFTAFRYVAWTPMYPTQIAACTGAGLAAPATLATA